MAPRQDLPSFEALPNVTDANLFAPADHGVVSDNLLAVATMRPIVMCSWVIDCGQACRPFLLQRLPEPFFICWAQSWGPKLRLPAPPGKRPRSSGNALRVRRWRTSLRDRRQSRAGRGPAHAHGCPAASLAGDGEATRGLSCATDGALFVLLQALGQGHLVQQPLASGRELVAVREVAMPRLLSLGLVLSVRGVGQEAARTDRPLALLEPRGLVALAILV
mmetsp:Transcript_6413/g.15886  ORF Transcript_6413/g.15886 Transcript_6413/m.15886 type:complete len:220 (+) Transcript_6413:213-872(+)